MPVPTPTAAFTSTFDRASKVTSDVWQALQSCPVPANVILPHVLKCLKGENNGLSVPEGQYWIACSSYTPRPTVEFILSSTESDMGKYPIFIMTTVPYSQLTFEFLHPRMIKLAQALLEVVSPARVYSVFAPEPITRVFCDVWSQLTRIATYSNPYYHANVTFCTKRTFVNKKLTVHPDQLFDLRPAVASDLEAVAELCKGFSSESEPFVLTTEGARKEASILIQNRQVWVHTVRRGNSEEIASLAAFTRTTDTVSTITKVYTSQHWRRQGCAERLVRRLCKELLLTKEYVALYVAHDNPAAAHVYRRVGFVGLDNKPVEGVDSWLEIGFDRNAVTLGHW